MPELTNVIYGLHSGDGVIRYVGLTTKTVRERLRTHRSTAKRGSTYPVYNWMRKHGLATIEATILEVVPLDGDLCAAEDRWIARYAATGAGLLNLTAGGDCTAALFWNDERREALAASRRGQKASEETRARQSAAHAGTVHGAGTRAKMAASISASWTPERRASHAASVTGSGHPQFGVRWSDERKREFSLSRTPLTVPEILEIKRLGALGTFTRKEIATTIGSNASQDIVSKILLGRKFAWVI